MTKKYVIEREGQIDFFKDFRIDYENNEVLVDNTDGVWNGNLLEFKLEINNLNKVLGQAVKYLSSMRIKGESVPANILLISLNDTTVYHYKSSAFFDEIHEVYSGAASKDNDGFMGKPYIKKYDYMDKANMSDVIELQNLLNTKEYLPINLDENCIVGWAERYYRENPKASKGDFLGDEEGQVKIIGEIREPKHFKGLINPYEGKTNEKFKYLMDKLNDRLKRKDLGAFYTPIPYCEKAAELVRKAIDRVPKGNDYIILDRCAGTGNLESVLTDEELGHCILSTYEYYEYKVLVERLGDKVRAIIPPRESMVDYANGCVRNADALRQEYIENSFIKSFLDNPNCTIILYENPPYRDMASNSMTKATGKENKYVLAEMKKEIKGTATNDLANVFIWSAFKFYLRQPTDSYILFSPIKYWKTCNLVHKHFEEGFLFNREHFHATPSALSCILWTNVDEEKEEVSLSVYDIKDNKLYGMGKKSVKKAYTVFSVKLYDKRVDYRDTEDGVSCNLDGTERRGNKGVRVKKLYNENIIGYINANSFNLNALSRVLIRCVEYNGNGFYLRKDNYKEKLPLWVAKVIPLDSWYDVDIYATTSDGGDKYTQDKDFLKCCLIYTCLSNQNKCLSFKGSDGREYQNELCFDKGALALEDLNKMDLNEDEKELMSLWYKILDEVKQTKEYAAAPQWQYGVYQIIRDINKFEEVVVGKTKTKHYFYPELNGDLGTLRVKLKEYYKKYITPLMFKYELLK